MQKTALVSATMNLWDKYGRTAQYLRLSITDRCNFNCIYCAGQKKSFIPHTEILRYEEMLRLIRIMQTQGIKKIRITGGEPFARKGCINFLYSIRRQFPDLRLCLTTNGSLLGDWINDLKKLSLDSINISLDSFKPETFAKITGHSDADIVINNIDKLLSAGLKVKINAVAMRGITDTEIDDFIHAVSSLPADIRFIEFMPMGKDTIWNSNIFISAKALVDIIKNKGLNLKVDNNLSANNFSGPAKMYKIKNKPGRFGFISALTSHFCTVCNRLRLTSNGRLRLCLFADREYNLAPLIRNSLISDKNIACAIAEAAKRKPLGANLLENRKTAAVSNRHMDGIGG